jgi:hypothetical protein
MSVREKDDSYDRIVAQLGSKHRVIVCADDHQWIVQEKRGKEWRGLYFCTSREGVLRWVKGLPGWEVLVGLPDRFVASQGAKSTFPATALPAHSETGVGTL